MLELGGVPDWPEQMSHSRMLRPSLTMSGGASDLMFLGVRICPRFAQANSGVGGSACFLSWSTSASICVDPSFSKLTIVVWQGSLSFVRSACYIKHSRHRPFLLVFNPCGVGDMRAVKNQSVKLSPQHKVKINEETNEASSEPLQIALGILTICRAHTCSLGFTWRSHLR